jgi:hypothetical protein
MQTEMGAESQKDMPISWKPPVWLIPSVRAQDNHASKTVQA